MVADNGPLYACVNITHEISKFPTTVAIYNNVYTVSLIYLMLFLMDKKNMFFFQKQGHF
jgi:hypothetical protein